MMKDKIYYTVNMIGFVAGILFYTLNLVMSNAETSFTDPTLKEFFRNPDYFTVFLYGLIGAGTLLLLTALIRNSKV